MGENALSDGRNCAADGRNCAARWEKLRNSDGRNCAELPERVSEPQKQPKNAFFDAQNGGKMGFLKPNLVGNARQMGEIALKNDFQLS